MASIAATSFFVAIFYPKNKQIKQTKKQIKMDQIYISPKMI